MRLVAAVQFLDWLFPHPLAAAVAFLAGMALSFGLALWPRARYGAAERSW